MSIDEQPAPSSTGPFQRHAADTITVFITASWLRAVHSVNDIDTL